jgi:hypothetical protein
LTAALCVASGLAQAQVASAPSVLPAGSPLTFVADDAVNPKSVQAGSSFKVHLRGGVLLDGETVAADGTLARLVVVERTKAADGSPAIQFALDSFRVRGGDLPIAPLAATVAGLTPGTPIPAKTMGSVERLEGRFVIHVSLPFSLPADVPNAAFTPVPAQTAQPRAVPPVRVRRPSPAASPSPASE